MGCKDMAKVKRRRRQRKEVGRGGGAVERKMKKLQRLVPGGSKLKPEHLFLRTAQHILQLRFKLNVLQALAKIFNYP